jgi:hypothetical protein
MSTISKTKFAKEIKVSDAYIYKIQDQLTLVKVKGKKKKQIDLLGTATLEFLKKREVDNINLPTEDTDNELENPRVGSSNNPSGLANQQNNIKEEEPLKDKKTRKQIEELELKIEQKRGNLIEKNLTDIFFGKIYQIDSDQLKQLGSNLSPRLFRIINERNKLKTNEICELFETTDKDLKESVESILNSGEKEVKTKIVGVFEVSVSDILKTIKEEIDNFLDLLEADAV